MRDQPHAHGVERREARHLRHRAAERRRAVRVFEQAQYFVLEQLAEVLRGEGSKLLAAEGLDALERTLHRGAKHHSITSTSATSGGDGSARLLERNLMHSLARVSTDHWYLRSRITFF